MSEARKAVHELIDTLKELDSRFLDGPAAITDEQTVLEGLKWMFTILQIGLDVYVLGDDQNPQFVDIAGPGSNKKWGGDNSDAFYQHAPVDGSRTYRVRGRRGDAVYLSLTVYGGPKDGRYSDRIVSMINDRELDIAPDGTFEITLSPDQQPGNWLPLAPDAVAAVTRDYLADPTTGRRAEWRIEAVDPPQRWRNDDADLAKRFRAARTWIETQTPMGSALMSGTPNQTSEPYPVAKVTRGWAAGDACYAMGSFDLAPGEAMYIDGASPDCAFWNVCLWNAFMQTFNYKYERVTLNGEQAVYNDDGSWTIVIAHEDPGHPNWISTAGHRRGAIFFRWFLASELPKQPSVRVVRQ